MHVSMINALAGGPSPTTRALAEPGRADQAAAEERRKVGAQFEAILVRQLLSESIGSMLGAANGPAGNVYGYMLTDVLAGKLTEGQGLGFGRMLEEQLTPRGMAVPAESANNTPAHP